MEDRQKTAFPKRAGCWRKMIRSSRRWRKRKSLRLEPRLGEIEEQLKVLLLPKDPLDDKNVVLEIRAGTGGDEATLFAAEIFRMYSRYAETQGWKMEDHIQQRFLGRRPQGSHRAGQRQQGLQQAQVRERRAPRAARAGDRNAGPRSHFGDHGCRAARSGRRRNQARSQGRPRRYLLLVRARAANRSTPPIPPSA